MSATKWYQSPRWSQEILDCSMPMTFDTYSKCSFDCLYCFSYFQKSHSMLSGKGGDYITSELRHVNPERIKKLMNLEIPGSQFNQYVKDKKVIQWGGLADQFDNHEKKVGATLELLKIFKKLNYPLCFSTKATWWLKDERYLSLFRGQDNWNCKFSIICLDEGRAKKMERGVDTPMARIEAIRTYSKLNKGGATLRLRPFIIGLTDRNEEYIELIRLAGEAGAKAVSTEFLCVEGRADERLKERYTAMSKIVGYDILEFYKKSSTTQGYYRLNRQIKEPYVRKMNEACAKAGMKLYVSDAHFKEACANGSCCGLSEKFNYSRGQFTEALLLAKKNGKVHFSEISKEIKKYHSYQWGKAEGYNTNSIEKRVSQGSQSMFDYIREQWNTPNSARSPYKYFNGVLFPVGIDKNGDVVYEYRAYKGGAWEMPKNIPKA